jgi:tellurite methyltransferase
VNRAVVAFRQDDSGEWVADLSCLHAQHVRHQPPFRLAPWVLDQGERAARVGSSLDCPLCDRAELPDGLRLVRTTEVWDEHTMPAALRRAHRVAAGTWGRLRVERGGVRFRAETHPPLDVVVGPDTPQAIPPEVEHHVEPLGEVRFAVEFLRRG